MERKKVKSELDVLLEDIKHGTSQISTNKVDEIKVMKCMLNDKEFTVGSYDKNMGYLGERCPHDEAVEFVKNVIMASTGLDSKESKHLANCYQFTSRDATFLLTNMRDFITTYMSTGRKFTLMQTDDSEAAIYTKRMESREKLVPDKDNPGKSKSITTKPYTKLVAISKNSNYAKENINED